MGLTSESAPRFVERKEETKSSAEGGYATNRGRNATSSQLARQLKYGGG